MTDPTAYPWWLASRSAGIVAWVALSASVALGLLMATRRLRGPFARKLHERVALLSLGAVAAHGLLLLPDPWLKPGVAGVLVPFASPYRPLWTGLGVLAAYLAAGLSLTYYARKRLGIRRWRTAHRFIPVAWAMAAAHVLGSGTDAGSLWLQAPVLLVLAALAGLLVERSAGAGISRPPRAAAPGPR